jgi:hypothetical protein
MIFGIIPGSMVLSTHFPPFSSRIFLILLFLTIGNSLSWGQKNCVLRKDRDSVKVYTCDPDQLKFKWITASFTVNATSSQLVAMLMDIDHYGSWQYKTLHPHILKKINDQEIIYYVEIVAPWPVSNRDMVNHFKVTQDANTKVVTITVNGVPEFIPKKDKIVRVPSSSSQWTIVPLGPSKVSVNYSIQIDPGGSVPVWMVNLVAAQAPYESFTNLRDQIRARNYPKNTIVQDY